MLCLAILAPPVFAQAPMNFESGARQTVMIELFTSEGCSSCPPAEEYLNSFVGKQQLWSRYIPVAMHVDYWDYLGWKDIFASPAYSQRQQQYARVTRARTVFTPAFFVNGENWRPGLLRNVPRPQTPDVGNLAVRLDGNRVSARFVGTGNKDQYLNVHIGLLGMGLKTNIRSGENAGRSARHEFVLLKQARLGEVKNGTWAGELPGPGSVKADRYAFIAWVSRTGSPAPIQALGGPLP